VGIGLGIFAGLALLGIIYLYTQTKDRWNWSRMVKRLLIGIGILIAAYLALIAGVLGFEKINEYLDSRPAIIKSYGGITIGEKVADVEFRSETKEVDKDGIHDFKRFEIKNTNLLFDVKKDSDKVDSIMVDCRENDKDTINGISCGDTSEEIFNKFGKSNIQVYCKKPDPKEPELKQIRLYESQQYLVTYGMHLNKVRAIFVKGPDSRKKSESWILCDSQN
jgi:hypothetical protein